MIFLASPILTLFTSILLALHVAAAPMNATEFEGLGEQARDIIGRAKRLAPAAPHFVIYADRYQSGVTGPPPVASVKVQSSFCTQLCCLSFNRDTTSCKAYSSDISSSEFIFD